MQSKVSLNRQPNEFVAYFNERDGRGFLKDSQDSALQQMVRISILFYGNIFHF